jgi:hypothetical protein
MYWHPYHELRFPAAPPIEDRVSNQKLHAAPESLIVH